MAEILFQMYNLNNSLSNLYASPDVCGMPGFKTRDFAGSLKLASDRTSLSAFLLPTIPECPGAHVSLARFTSASILRTVLHS